MHQDNQLKSWKWFQKSNYELFLHVPHRPPRQTPVLSMCATALSPEGPGLPGQGCEPAHCSLGSNVPLWTPLRFLSACPCLPSGLPHPLPPRSRLCAHPRPPALCILGLHPSVVGSPIPVPDSVLATLWLKLHSPQIWLCEYSFSASPNLPNLWAPKGSASLMVLIMRLLADLAAAVEQWRRKPGARAPLSRWSKRLVQHQHQGEQNLGWASVTRAAQIHAHACVYVCHAAQLDRHKAGCILLFCVLVVVV